MINKVSCLLLLVLVIGCSVEGNKSEQEAEVLDLPPKDFQRFELKKITETGITFANYLTETNELNIVSYEYLYNGGGVAVADFDGDGLQDIFFTGTMVPEKLYLNQGNLKFKDFTRQWGIEQATGFKTGVSIVDINTDGKPDVYVSRTGSGAPADRENLLYVNQGDGFEEQGAKYGINSDSHSNHGYFFDYDRDGDLDLFVLNHPTDFLNSQDVRVQPSEGGGFERITTPKTDYDSDQLYRNNGNGTFTDVSKRSGINNYGYGLSATIGDFNNDGYDDIYVANDYVEPDILYINQKDGTYLDRIDDYLLHITQNSMGSDFNDINNDGLNDLIVVDMIAADQKRQKSLLTSMTYDRHETLLRLGYKDQQMRNLLHLNNDNGTYSEIGQMLGVSNTDWSWAPLFADFNNDGLKDLFISNGYRKDLTNCDFTIYKSDSLKKAEVSDIYDYLNLIPSTEVPNYIFRNLGDFNFQNMQEDWGFNATSFSNGSAYADLDNDGDLDIITNNIDKPAFIYENKSENDSLNHYLQVKLSFDKTNPMAVGAKVKILSESGWQYQDLRLTRGYFSSVESIVHFGVKEELVDSLVVTWPNNRRQILTNLKVDQRLDIAYSKEESDEIIDTIDEGQIDPTLKAGTFNVAFEHQENAYEDFLREPFIPHKYSELGPTIATADINGDGMDDFLFGSSINSTMKLFLSKQGTYEEVKVEAFDADAKNEEGELVFLDIDGDDDLDIYATSSGNEYSEDVAYQDRIYLNENGTYKRANGILPLITSSTYAVESVDYDKDGDMDLVVGGRVLPGKYPLAPRSYLLRNDNGSFRDVTSEVFPELEFMGMITDIVWTSLDGKNSQLVIVGEYLPISAFEFEGGKFKPAETSGLNKRGWWNTVEMVDVNNDGLLDIVAGNLGYNSKYHAYPNKPFCVYAKDFDGNGSIDPIHCQFIGDTSWPIPQKNTVTKHIPRLQSKLAKYEKYSESTINDIFSEDELEESVTLTVDVFGSSVFLNKGDMNFARIDLHPRAQFSPIYSISSADINEDGFMDLFLGGNKNGTEVERGPYNSLKGLALFGKGDGTFTAPVSLGLDGEIRDSKFIEMNNTLNLIVLRNNQPVEIFSF